MRANLFHQALNAVLDHHLSPPDGLPDLTPAEQKAVTEALAEKADDEYDARSEPFTDWLDGNKSVRQAYVAFRVANASDDDVIAAEMLVGVRG